MHDNQDLNSVTIELEELEQIAAPMMPPEWYEVGIIGYGAAAGTLCIVGAFALALT